MMGWGGRLAVLAFLLATVSPESVKTTALKADAAEETVNATVREETTTVQNAAPLDVGTTTKTATEVGMVKKTEKPITKTREDAAEKTWKATWNDTKVKELPLFDKERKNRDQYPVKKKKEHKRPKVNPLLSHLPVIKAGQKFADMQLLNLSMKETATGTTTNEEEQKTRTATIQCLEESVGPCMPQPRMHGYAGKQQQLCRRVHYLNPPHRRSYHLTYNPQDSNTPDIFNLLRSESAVPSKNSKPAKDIRYLCIEEKAENPSNPLVPSVNSSKEAGPSRLACYCNGEDFCHIRPLHSSYTYSWTIYYETRFVHWPTMSKEERRDVIKEIYEKLEVVNQSYTDPSKSYHVRKEQTPRETSVKVTAKTLTCPIEETDAEFLVTALEWEASEQDTDRAGCPDAPWQWTVKGTVTSELSGVEYSFGIELSACASLLEGNTSWAFLSKPEVRRVFRPCHQLPPGQSQRLQVDHVTLRLLHLAWSDIKLHPTPDIHITCRNHHPPPPPPLGLNELGQRLWIAIAVCLIEVILVAPLLVIVAIRLENADQTVSSIVSMNRDRLAPFRLFFSVPSGLVESFGEGHGVGGLSDEFESARAVSSDHRELKDYNFFGWRTGFDYRILPCLGKPPKKSEPVKCTCLDCQHAPRVSLARLIKPTRLLEMGLGDWALVDRKDPLYNTFHGVRTKDHLPRDSASPCSPRSKSPDSKPSHKTASWSKADKKMSTPDTSYVNDAPCPK